MPTPTIRIPRLKRRLFYVWIFGEVLVFLLSACAPSFPTANTTQTPVPTTLSDPSFTNPVYNKDFPDPYVLLVGDTYYAYGTTNGSTVNIRAIKSQDLAHWEEQGDALAVLPEWSVRSSGYTWAPGVIEIGDQFLMYYVARDKDVDRQCIGVAVSEDANGPFTDSNEHPFICQAELGGSIDPYPFKNDDGKLYLLWKNDGNCCDLEVALWVQELSPDGMSLVGEPVKLIKRDQAWEEPLIENPAMVKHNDRYYLFYSGNWWESREYAIGYAVCETVTGPCEKPLNPTAN